MKKKRLKIAVDIDGVIANNSIQNWMKKIREIYPRFHLNGKDIIPTSYKIENITGLPRQEIMELFTKSTIENKPIILPECIDFLNYCYQNHCLLIVTARESSLVQETYDWLHTNNIKYHEIIFTNGRKSEIAIEEGFDVVIDDNISEYLELDNEPVKFLLFNREWNQSHNLADKFIRIYEWSEAMDEVINLEKMEYILQCK